MTEYSPLTQALTHGFIMRKQQPQVPVVPAWRVGRGPKPDRHPDRPKAEAAQAAVHAMADKADTLAEQGEAHAEAWSALVQEADAKIQEALGNGITLKSLIAAAAAAHGV